MPRIRKPQKPYESNAPNSYWLLGLYERLSKEDKLKQLKEAAQSRSIDNQDLILNDFVDEYFEEGSYEIVDTFIDDGLTGTDENRPRFQDLKKLILEKKVNCVIFKSLSRAFRNLADQSKFLEEFCPLHKVRVINAGEPFIDTYERPRSASSMEVPIHGLMNERFAESTSLEVRKTFNAKRKNGEFIGSFAAYGYKKDPNDKNRLLVDEEAADIVRSIYNWFVNKGYSKAGIAKKLNQMGEPNPEAYKKKKGLKYTNPNSHKNDGLWSPSTIARILQNAVYTGDMVQGRYRVISYKVHKQINVPEEEWFVVPNTHEAVISKELFDKAQALHQRDTRTAPGQKEVYLLSGFVRCADCKKAMRRKSSRNITYYACRTFSDKQTCTKHSIRQDKLEAAVLAALQVQIALVDALAEEVDKIISAPVIHRESKSLSHSLIQAEKQLRQNNDALDSLYMDWKNGDITKAEYHRLKGKITQQIQQLEQNAAYLKEEMQIMSDGTNTGDPYLAAFLKRRNIQTLNRGIVVELINTVWVHECGEITVDFNFADEYQRVVDYIENNHNTIVLIENKPTI